MREKVDRRTQDKAADSLVAGFVLWFPGAFSLGIKHVHMCRGCKEKSRWRVPFARSYACGRQQDLT